METKVPIPEGEAFTELTEKQLAVYRFLLRCAGDGDRCFPSVGRIAQSCKCSTSTVRRTIAELERREIIRRAANYMRDRYGRLRQTSNDYQILMKPGMSDRLLRTGGANEN